MQLFGKREGCKKLLYLDHGLYGIFGLIILTELYGQLTSNSNKVIDFCDTKVTSYFTEFTKLMGSCTHSLLMSV